MNAQVTHLLTGLHYTVRFIVKAKFIAKETEQSPLVAKLPSVQGELH